MSLPILINWYYVQTGRDLFNIYSIKTLIDLDICECDMFTIHVFV